MESIVREVERADFMVCLLAGKKKREGKEAKRNSMLSLARDSRIL